MANVTEIGEIVKKCKFLLLDIEGTITSINFVKAQLFPYAEANVRPFLEKHWDTDDVKEAVSALRTQATEDQEKSVEGFVAVAGEDASKEEQIESLVKNVKWQMSIDRKAGPLKQLQGLIWKEGYDNGDIKGHVYDDVSPALELWRATEGQKIYIYSSGSVQAQKLLFNKSVAGDMLPLIDGHFDTAVGAKQEAASYAAIVEKIGCKADEILFLTDIVKEAEAARASGLQTALVSREGNAPLGADAASFALLHSLDQLALTNKRKQPQEEEVPAKVPKTDLQDDVKSAVDAETNKTNGNTEVKPDDVAETMEVEETSETVATELKAENIAEAEDVPMAGTETVAPENVDSVSSVIETSNIAKKEKSPIEMPADHNVINPEVVMVDAATVTERQHTVDAATETVEISKSESKPEESNIEKAPIETPIVEAVETNDATKTGIENESKPNEVNTIIHNSDAVEELTKTIEIETKASENGVDTATKDPVVVADEVIECAEEAVEKPASNIEPIVEEIGEKTEKKETEETKVNEIETVEPIENPQAETEVNQETETGIEIKDITDDKQSLSEITDTSEHAEPIVEEPSSNLEAEELQNAGDVLEKECDEILSKVQDVTNLDFIPVKPLQTISEEMETENTDSNDIVDTILDTEMELGMKPGDNQNVISDIKSDKVDSTEDMVVQANGTAKDVPKIVDDENLETTDVQVEAIQENNVEKMDTEQVAVPENNVVDNVIEADSCTDSKVSEKESEVILEQVSEKADTVSEKVTELDDEKRPKDTPAVVEVPDTTAKSLPDAKVDALESKVNGKTNGDAVIKINGNSTQEDELKSRLASENGKEKVNGSNGDSAKVEIGQGDNEVTNEIAEIKVKTVATGELCAPIEQPVEV